MIRMTSPALVRYSTHQTAPNRTSARYTIGSYPNSTGPMMGTSESTGTWIGPTGSIGAAPKFRPRKPESPPPRIARAIPAAYWLASRVRASTPNRSDDAAPAATAASTATGAG